LYNSADISRTNVQNGNSYYHVKCANHFEMDGLTVSDTDSGRFWLMNLPMHKTKLIRNTRMGQLISSILLRNNRSPNSTLLHGSSKYNCNTKS